MGVRGENMSEENKHPDIVEDDGMDMEEYVAKVHKDGRITLEPVQKSQ